ncbi:helix-turn-helix domain-containing protein [Nocardia cyriacigeorgica]|uniref:helix-turn-helix domain-containing protein n=1 Tax=Nocardia cyriacigeorgica TaxID=135487 RepID=UPI00245393EE|nr:helix-turn-helix transcriptional regulator [Nocardia cyriacigeorgica]
MGTQGDTPAADDDGIDLAVGTALRVLRARRQISQRELARRTGLAKNTIYRIEHAERSIDVRQLFKIAEALDVTPTELLTSAVEELALEDRED